MVNCVVKWLQKRLEHAHGPWTVQICGAALWIQSGSEPELHPIGWLVFWIIKNAGALASQRGNQASYCWLLPLPAWMSTFQIFLLDHFAFNCYACACIRHLFACVFVSVCVLKSFLFLYILKHRYKSPTLHNQPYWNIRTNSLHCWINHTEIQVQI